MSLDLIKNIINTLDYPAFAVDEQLKILSSNKAASNFNAIPDLEKYIKENNLAAEVKSSGNNFSKQINLSGENTYLMKATYADQEKIFFISFENHQNSKIAELEARIIKAQTDFQSFVYKVSHDLKGPVFSITSLTELGKAESQDETTQQFFDMILLSTKKTEVLLDKLLEVSRIISHPIKMEEVNIKKIIDDSIEKVNTLRQVPIEFKINTADIQISSDAFLLDLIIFNLIDNAVVFRNRKITDPHCHISIKKSAGKILFECTDNGMGIDPNKFEKVYELFYRGSDYSEGVGLGLYVVKTGIERLAGRVTLSSKKDEGSTFTLEIPLTAGV